jgi:hypothetical protein
MQNKGELMALYILIFKFFREETGDKETLNRTVASIPWV